jgi:hypothetical protein
LMLDVLWLPPPLAAGPLHYYDPPRVIGKGADFESLAPLAGLVGKEGADEAADVGLAAVFGFLDFEPVSEREVVKGARFLEPVVTKAARPNPKAIFAAEARSFARGTRSSGSIMPGRKHRKT